MVAYVRSNNVLEKNGLTYMWGSSYPNGLAENIPVEGTTPAGVFWKVPVVKFTNSIEVGYTIMAVDPANPSTPPSIDAVKMLRLKNDFSNQEWGIAIANTDEESGSTPQSQWAYLSDGTGGTLPVMPAVTIPVPLIQRGPITSTTSGGVTTNTFTFTFPANPVGVLYTIQAAYFNGAAPTQAYEPSGITTLAQFVTWANTSGKWDDYGTWSSPNTTTLRLVSTSSDTVPVNMAGIIVPALTAANHTLDMSVVATPAFIDGVGFGGGVPIPFKDGGFLCGNTTASKNAVIAQIGKIYQSNMVTCAISGSNNIIVTTTLGVCVLYDGNSAVVTSS